MMGGMAAVRGFLATFAPTTLLGVLTVIVGGLAYRYHERDRLLENMPVHWAGGVVAPVNEPHVVIVLQPRDCSEMVTTLERFAQRLRATGISVHGLLSVNPNDSALADSLISGRVVSFRLERTHAADLAVVLRTLGITATPVVVLADGHGRVRYLAPFDSSLIGGEADRIIAIMRRLRSPSGDPP